MLVEFGSGFFWCLGALSAMVVSIVSVFLVVKLWMKLVGYITRRAEEEECQEE